MGKDCLLQNRIQANLALLDGARRSDGTKRADNLELSPGLSTNFLRACVCHLRNRMTTAWGELQ